MKKYTYNNDGNDNGVKDKMAESKKLADSKKLAHYISSANVCSRRQAEKYIEEGRVSVNGIIVTNVATRVNQTDSIILNNKAISLLSEEKIWLYYKPVRSITSHVQEDGKTTIFDLVWDRIGYVISVGRLDYMSEGLILLTNSNAIADQMMKGSYKRVYKVLVDYVPTDIYQLEQDFTLDGIRYKAWKIKNIHENWITLELYEGKNREIRKVLSALDTYVIRLIRVQYGPYKLLGEPNNLFEGDINKLKNYQY